MTLFVKDIMVTDFDTIHEDAHAEEAIFKISNGAVRKSGHKNDTLLVVDDTQKLVGIVTMFDVLYHLRPEYLNCGIDGETLNWRGQIKSLIDSFQGKKVHNIMSYNVQGANMDDHIMIVLDRLIKNKFRRLPVLVDERPIGLIYIADIYFHLFSKTNPYNR